MTIKTQTEQSHNEFKRSEDSWKRELTRVDTEKTRLETEKTRMETEQSRIESEKNQLLHRIQTMEMETKEKQETLMKEREYREAKQQLLAGG